MPCQQSRLAAAKNILNIDFFWLQIRITVMSRRRRNATKGGARKDKPPSDYEEEEEEGEQGEETIPKQGKAASVAEALADTQAELEAQSAIPSAGKESGKESADSAKLQSYGALNEVKKMRLKDENADLQRKLEELEEKHKSSPVRKSTISKCYFE